LLDTCVLDLGMAILIMMYHYCFLKNFADKDNYTQQIILLDEGWKIGLNKKYKWYHSSSTSLIYTQMRQLDIIF
jgi:hypothetical protein